jgi:regulator of ribosome biosynthesis
MQAELPKPTTVLPREKPAPKPKEETRWEAFAKEKGIKKRKRERMVWDEEKKEWAPRWGYKVGPSARACACVLSAHV